MLETRDDNATTEHRKQYGYEFERVMVLLSEEVRERESESERREEDESGQEQWTCLPRILRRYFCLRIQSNTPYGQSMFICGCVAHPSADVSVGTRKGPYAPKLSSVRLVLVDRGWNQPAYTVLIGVLQ